MAQAGTYTDKSVKESLYDVITMISPTDTQLWSGLEKKSISSAFVEWPIDALNAIDTANQRIEGFDATFAARVDPGRANNRTQILSREFNVTDTERSVDHAGFQDRYSREMTKAMTEWSQDAEYFLMRGSLATGSGTGARGMAGLLNQIVTNATNAAGGTLLEAGLNDYLQNAWTTGGKVDEIYTSIKGKRRISSFTAGNVKNINVDDKRLVNRVDVYESDMGVHKLFAHRWIDYGTGTTSFTLVGLQSDKWAVGSLRDPKHTPLAKTGDATKGMIVGEFTLMGLAEASSFKTTNLV